MESHGFFGKVKSSMGLSLKPSFQSVSSFLKLFFPLSSLSVANAQPIKPNFDFWEIDQTTKATLIIALVVSVACCVAFCKRTRNENVHDDYVRTGDEEENLRHAALSRMQAENNFA